MNSNNKIFAIILARGGSKTIPNKNSKRIYNSNCLELTIKSLLTILPSENILVSSDSNLILDIAKNLGTLIVQRPDYLSTDIATSESGWIHAIGYLEKIGIRPSTIIAPQVTSPLRYKETFKAALEKFGVNDYDSLFSAIEISSHLFEWSLDISNSTMSPISFNPYISRMRRQDHEDKVTLRIRENGSFFIFKREGFLNYGNRLFGEIGYYLQDKLESIEIDDDLDWELAESVLKQKNDLFIY